MVRKLIKLLFDRNMLKMMFRHSDNAHNSFNRFKMASYVDDVFNQAKNNTFFN